MKIMSSDTDQALAEGLRAVLLSFDREGYAALAELAALYDRDMVFGDPLQTLHGREAFLAMNRRILRRARRVSFEIHDALGKNGSVFLTWTMHYVPRRGPAIRFEGATHARVRLGLIVEQRDYWDLLSSVAGSVPLVGRAYAALAPHLA